MFYSVNNYSSANSRKGISGLASGMDTDELVEKLTGTTRTKITNKLQTKTLTEWKQDAYRESIDKLSSFKSKYFSTGSSTNLLSSNYFKVATIKNNYGDIVTATGDTDAAKNLVITSVSQLASTSQFATDEALSSQSLDSGALENQWRQSLVDAGSLTIRGDNASFQIVLDRNLDLLSYGANSDADKDTIAANLVKELNAAITRLNEKSAATNEKNKDKVGYQELPMMEGRFKLDGNRITLTDDYTVTGGTSALFEGLGYDKKAENPASEAPNDIDVTKFYKDNEFENVMAGTSVTFTLNGVSKKITFEKSEMAQYSVASTGDADADNKKLTENVSNYLQKKLDEAYGAGKVTVAANKKYEGTNIERPGLSFQTASADSILTLVSSTSSSVLGKKGALRIVQNESNRVNLAKSIGGNYDSDEAARANGLTTALKPNADGKYRISVNGKIITLDRNSLFGDIASKINSANVGVTVKYSSATDKFTIMASDSGTSGRIEIKDVSDADLLGLITKGEPLSGKLVGADGKLTTDGTGDQVYALDADTSLGLLRDASGNWKLGAKTVVGVTDTGKFVLADDGGFLNPADLNTYTKADLLSALKTGTDTGYKYNDGTTDYNLYAIQADSRLGITQGNDGFWHVTDKDGNDLTIKGMVTVGGREQLVVSSHGTEQLYDLDDQTKLQDLFGDFNGRGNSNLSDALFGTDEISTSKNLGGGAGKFTIGQDAIFSMSFDGNPANAVSITRTSNNFTVDGVNLELHKTTGASVSGQSLVLKKNDGTTLALKLPDNFTTTSVDHAPQEVLDALNDQIPAGTALKFELDNGKVRLMDTSGSTPTLATGVAIDKAPSGSEGLYSALGIRESITAGTTTSTLNFDASVNGSMMYRDPDAQPITFDVDANVDELYEKIKTFVDDYNAVVDDLNNKLSEMPATDENHKRVYHPLSQEEANDMSDTEVEEWTKKAKQGILYGDTNYNSTLVALRRAVSDSVGALGESLAKYGISTGKPGDWSASSNKNGQLVIDETTLRTALAGDPESIIRIFTQKADSSITDRTSDTWSTQDRLDFSKQAGISQRINQALQDAVGTFGTTGVLVQMAGKNSHVSAYDNFMTTQIQSYNSQLSNLKDRLKAEEDRYYKQFANMEQMIQNMNSQSEWLSQQFSS